MGKRRKQEGTERLKAKLTKSWPTNVEDIKLIKTTQKKGQDQGLHTQHIQEREIEVERVHNNTIISLLL